MLIVHGVMYHTQIVGELGHGPTLPSLSVPTLPLLPHFDFTDISPSDMNHSILMNFIVAKNCQHYPVSHVQTLCYVP